MQNNDYLTKAAQDRFYGCMGITITIFAAVALIIGYWATH